MATVTCQAIVLSTRPYGDNDFIVSLFTLEHGRVKGFAKGARSSKRRFSGALMAGRRLDLSLVLNEHGLSRLIQVEHQYPVTGPHNDLYTLALLLYLCELVEALTPEGQPIPRLFRLFALLLEYTRDYPLDCSIRCFFEINLLNILGYGPDLSGQAPTPLHRCLNTSKFGSITFETREHEDARTLLDSCFAAIIPYRLKSSLFLESV